MFKQYDSSLWVVVEMVYNIYLQYTHFSTDGPQWSHDGKNREQQFSRKLLTMKSNTLAQNKYSIIPILGFTI
jgi:hypothetical protein